MIELNKVREKRGSEFLTKRNSLLLSRREMAEICGITQVTIFKIENGKPCAWDSVLLYEIGLNKLLS